VANLKFEQEKARKHIHKIYNTPDKLEGGVALVFIILII